MKGIEFDELGRVIVPPLIQEDLDKKKQEQEEQVD